MARATLGQHIGPHGLSSDRPEIWQDRHSAEFCRVRVNGSPLRQRCRGTARECGFGWPTLEQPAPEPLRQGGIGAKRVAA
jgi:hypothetical protein